MWTVGAVDFSDSNLTGAIFDDTTEFSEGGDGVDFSGTNSDLSNLDFSNMDTVGWNYGFKGANLSSVNLSNANLMGVAFDTFTIFSDGVNAADLNNTVGTGAVLSGDFANVNFSKVHLWGVDLSGATLTGSNVLEATYDPNTQWPIGFDADAGGAIGYGMDDSKQSNCLGSHCCGEPTDWHHRGRIQRHRSGYQCHPDLLFGKWGRDGNNSLFTLETNGTLEDRHHFRLRIQRLDLHHPRAGKG